MTDLKEIAEKCERKGGTLAVRTKFLKSFDNKVKIHCYGSEELPSGVIKNIPKEKVEKLRRELELKSRNAIEVIKEL